MSNGFLENSLPRLCLTRRDLAFSDDMAKNTEDRFSIPSIMVVSLRWQVHKEKAQGRAESARIPMVGKS